MRRFSSSTFSFRRRRRRARIWVALIWTATSLAALDAVLGKVFSYPQDPRQLPSPFQSYFNYGRSIEGKLRFAVRDSALEDGPAIDIGWLPNQCAGASAGASHESAIDVYGMSFSNQIADALAGLDKTLSIRNFGGPSASPNHSYACFVRRLEVPQSLAKVQIIGILASSVVRTATISGLTTSFESPEPFTYPRYTLASDGSLQSFLPTITTANELRAALKNPEEWNEFLEELRLHDAFYSASIVRSDVLDYSVIGRLIRRAVGQRIIRERSASLLSEQDASGSTQVGPVVRAIVSDFANKAREAQCRPVVILIEDHGYAGYLSQMMATALAAEHIEFIDTSSVISANDSANFVPDGHFKPEVNDAIARVLLKLLHGDA